ncbi:right-handed parallel beta-helix repeat-containing protein [Stygiobacter electus]|uniref:Right-handed parallel beta-helix repeat-containing protein n=1 Tax=Stygiobacter electus TaxID=3032292 RepID=A0AAE3P1P7_9BACT|nr:right-handed parallel beta-helix repeat-containing protein [Stygiobacter electus]MDF1612694.1 right-handed parallel beta-helix repeat-containing protein [Stygiobacter electus]
MKTITLKILSIFFISLNVVVAHRQSLHQYITREAFKLLCKSYPALATSEMAQYIGTNETSSATELSWGAGKIVSGVWIEDEYDIVYHYGISNVPVFNQWLAEAYYSLFPGGRREAFTSINHFWNADGGPNSTVDLHDYADGIYWSFSCENAMQKMYKYLNGDFDNRWLYAQGRIWVECGSFLYYYGSDMRMANLFELYNRVRTIYAVQYLGDDAQWHNAGGCPELNYGISFIYEQLGRMCHLLQDQSVPAHVHCNSHACTHGMYCDYYEDQAQNYHMWTADEIFSSGKIFIYPYNNWGGPLYYLMYLMNQTTDHYASGLTNGDNNYDTNCPLLSEIFSTLDLPITTDQINYQNCSAMHDKLFPLVIRATAGLLYWFAKEAGLIDEILVPYDYPSIDQAVASATPGKTIMVMPGTYYVTDNLSIPSEVILRVSPGSTVNFGSNVKLTISGGGTLTANGATFQGNGSAGSWNSIWSSANSSGSIEGCTIKDAQCGVYASTNANVTVSNCTITNNSLYGFSILSNSTVSISSCTISNNGTGVNISSSPVTIEGNTFLNNSSYSVNANNVSSNLYWHDNTFQGNGAMILNNASPWLYNNLITESSGVYITSGMPQFAYEPDNLRGYNVITCAGSPLVKADNYSTVYMGYDYDGGYNSIYGSDLPDMMAVNNSGVYADNNYWGGEAPAIYADETSWILARTPLSSDPNPPTCGFQKSLAVLAKGSSEVSSDISDKYWQAISEGHKGNYSTAKDLLKTIINGVYNNKYSPLALLALYDFKLRQNNSNKQDNSVITEWTNTVNSLYNSQGNSLRPFAVRLLAREAAVSNDTTKMLSYNKELVENYPNTNNELTALYDLIIYYTQIENNLTLANQYFTRMKETYPEEDLTKFAEKYLRNLGIEAEEKKHTEEIVTKEEMSFSISNYPNPFNPTTKIKYTIPNSEKVLIKVYDVLGREVKVLLNEYKDAGTYEIEFNATYLTSGLYFYKIIAGNKTETRKMMLVR